MGLKDVLRGEFIGLHAEVVAAQNASLVGLKGKIVDETRNTFTIECGGKEKKILKAHVTLAVIVQDKTYMIKGALLVARPEERLKKNFKV